MIINHSIKSIILIIISLILFISPLTISPVQAENTTWNENWSYNQKISTPIDTSQPESIYQPIDTTITFNSPCWAKNEIDHSIRICCWDGNDWHELESQIYDLQHTTNNQISTCNIVFLIPEYADGSETYHVFYDDSEKPAPQYENHVECQESSYRFEPISGYPLESEHFELIDDGSITYMISYNGKFMGYNTCQHIFKMREGSTEIVPKNTELFTAFDYKYCYEEGLFGYSSTSQKLLSKEIITDGNLMVEIGIESTSKLNDLKTTATYKFYHNPTSSARIHAHVKHETLKDITIYSEAKTDGAYASMQAGGVKSRSIQDLNIGQIFPYLHFHNELGSISSYDLDTDPEYIPEDPDIRVISIHDDVDLGSIPWISFDNGENQPTHSLIFQSNSVVTSGANEQDGIQINAFQMDYPHLAGLENNIATVQAGRNSVEPGQSHDRTIPNDLTVEFDAEFFSSYTDGYDIVDKEATLFQQLVSIKPQSTIGFNESGTQQKTHNLTIVIHNAPSTPLGSSLSVALGRNLSYITVELYKENEYLYSQNAVRLPLNAMEDLIDPTIFQQLKAAVNMLDLRNISFFKTASFTGIKEGVYVAKVFRENPLFSKQRQYLGYAIIDVQNSISTHIFCKKQATLDLTLIDQHQQPIMDAEIQLKQDDHIISSSITDEKGIGHINAPVSNTDYNLEIIYKGGIVYQESVSLNRLQRLITQQKTIEIKRFDLEVQVRDTWGQSPGVDLHPTLIRTSSEIKHSLTPDSISQGTMVFKDLPTGSYHLMLTFKSFTTQENITIQDDVSLTLLFPASYEIDLRILDVRGNNIDHIKLVISRNQQKQHNKLISSTETISLPPGEYQVQIYKSNQLIGKRFISVYGEKNYDMVTNQEPLYPLIIVFIGIAFVAGSLFYIRLKNKSIYFITVLIISLLITSLFFPWWEIQGESEQLDTHTRLFFIPDTMMSIHQTDESIAGETSFLPEEFQLAIMVIISATIVSCILLAFLTYSHGKRFLPNRVHIIIQVFIIILLIASITGFLFALNELCKISIGSIMGSGLLDVGIPGESNMYSITAAWGPAIGFYLYTVSTIIYSGLLIYPLIIRLRTNDADHQKK